MHASRALVWDLPVRVFHWLFAGGFIAAATIALLLGDDSPLFPYHAIIGLVLVFLVLLRVIWGFIGSRYARFSAQPYNPRALATYVGSALIGRAKRYVGANPGSAYAALAMMLLVIGLAGMLLGQYDSAAQTTRLPLIAGTLQLGEVESDEQSRTGSDHRDREHDDDDDDD